MQADNYKQTVDLKWSLWSADRGHWDEYAPGLWEWMREWFDASTDDGNPESTGLSDVPRVVHTAPRKEIRFGTVEFHPGQAIVHFWNEWDDGEDLEPIHIQETVEAETFEQLMKLIDTCEQRLIDAETAMEGAA